MDREQSSIIKTKKISSNFLMPPTELPKYEKEAKDKKGKRGYKNRLEYAPPRFKGEENIDEENEEERTLNGESSETLLQSRETLEERVLPGAYAVEGINATTGRNEDDYFTGRDEMGSIQADNSNLPVRARAELVDDNYPEAEVVKPLILEGMELLLVNNWKRLWNNRKTISLILVVTLLSSLVTTFTLLHFKNNSQSSTKEKIAEIITTSEFPSTAFFISNTPQSKAINWLTEQYHKTKTAFDDKEVFIQYTLSSFYFDMNGGDWNNSDGWLKGLDYCEWNGIKCEGREIVELNLSDNNLKGTLSTDIAKLTTLTKLDLSNNELTEIPSEVFGGIITVDVVRNLCLPKGGLQELEVLELQNNKLQTIPDNIGKISSLDSLWLYDNELSGTIPQEIFSMGNLTTLKISNNMLNGTISSSYGDLSRLRTLELSSNSLTGTIPREIFSMRNLNTLKISSNFLTGTIYADFTQLSSLEILDLEENFLSGSMPSKFDRISRLKRILLSTNKLTGPIPESINIVAPTLETLQLANNNLNMTIPLSFAEFRKLNTLRLDSNSLSGSLPTELGLLIDLQSMSMKSNLLTGRIPSELRSLQRLWVLDLSDNRLTGSIPSELGNLQVITNMRLQQNRLTGILPTELASASTLEILSVFRNNLIGKVGDELCRRNIEIQADCLGSDPEIECDCCLCYNDDQPTPVHSDAVSCDEIAKKLIEDNLVKGTRGDVYCYCTDTTGLHVRCDESCISCNLDETVCVENISLQMIKNRRDALFPDIYENKVKYIKGRNETIEWGSSGWEEWGSSGWEIDTCWVRINGVECNSCAPKKCANRNVPFISCSNVVGAGDYDGCDDILVENAGVFEAISWSNRRSLSLTGETYCPVLDTLNVFQ